ncbi:MAG: GrpB family protein [Chloroflexota bacterium]|nr:GrpB family protein [Chloroflexota bacterium]
MPYGPHSLGSDPARPVNTNTVIDGQVLLVDYDPVWPSMFAREATRIREILGDRVLRIEHIGSTSIPGIIAKPCIDIVLVVADAGNDHAYVPDLQRTGYVLRVSENLDGWGPHRLFNGREINMNLHVLSAGSPKVESFIAFRDWLRTHPADRDRYAAAKRDLASHHWQYMEDYADAKDDIVREITARIASPRAQSE